MTFMFRKGHTQFVFDLYGQYIAGLTTTVQMPLGVVSWTIALV